MYTASAHSQLGLGYFAPSYVVPYAADGTAIDYAVGKCGVTLALGMELWGEGDITPSCFDLFNPESAALAHAISRVRPALFAAVRFAVRRNNEVYIGVEQLCIVVLPLICLL